MSEQKQNPFVSQVENLPFHNFQEVDTITCIVENKLTLGEEEPFDVYVVNDLESGERKFLTASYTIEKQIEKAKEDNNNDLSQIVFLFVFQGKTEVKGKPFNQFNVSTCSLQQYEAYTAKPPAEKKGGKEGK